MKSLGDFDTSAVIYGKFTTFRPSTGAAFTLGGTPALSVYKDNSTTQSTTGVTLTADFDSVTGLNHFAIDTSADGTFYSSGSFFDIVITTGTVDSISVVGAVVASFTLRKTSALKPTTAARTLDVSAGGEAGVDWANVGSPTTTLNLSGTSTKALEPTTAGRTLDVSTGGEAGVDWANVGSPTTVVGLSGTTVKTATDVETDTADIQSRLPAALVSGRIDASTGAMASGVLTATAIAADAITAAKLAADVATEIVGTPAGASISADIAAIKAVLPAALVSGRIDASVGAMAANVLTATAINADAITAAKVAADVTTEIQSGLATAAALTTVSGKIDIIDDFLDTEIASILAGLGVIDEGTAQSATSTTLRLRSAAAFADDELIGATVLITGGTTGVGQSRLITDYVSSTDTATVDTWTTTPTGTITYKVFGTAPGSSSSSGLDAAGVRAAIGLASANLDTQLGAIDDFLDTEITDIRNRLPAALVSGRMDASVGAMAANVMTAAAAASDLTTELQSGLATAAGVTSATSGLATAAALAVVDGLLDTEVAAIKVVTDQLADTLEDQGGGTYGFTAAALTEAGGGGTVLDAAAVRAAIGLAASNLDAQISDLSGRLPDTLTTEGNLKADVRYQNGRQVYGSGTAGDKWRGTP